MSKTHHSRWTDSENKTRKPTYWPNMTQIARFWTLFGHISQQHVLRSMRLHEIRPRLNLHMDLEGLNIHFRPIWDPLTTQKALKWQNSVLRHKMRHKIRNFWKVPQIDDFSCSQVSAQWVDPVRPIKRPKLIVLRKITPQKRWPYFGPKMGSETLIIVKGRIRIAFDRWISVRMWLSSISRWT